MQLDPTRWFVSLAGFFYDWLITREWKQALLCWLPLFLLAGVAVAAASGNWRDRSQLAQWYMELGNEEIAEWETAWAPAAKPTAAETDAEGSQVESVGGTTTTGATTSSSDQTDSQQRSPEDPQVTENGLNADPTNADDPRQVSRFAETLFRRVQMLVPSERSQFVIAATLAQRGAIDQARDMLAKVAPLGGIGYAPAHALLAQLLLLDLQKKGANDQAEMVELTRQFEHHISEAKRWERCPRLILLAGSDLYWLSGEQQESLALLEMCAERYPEDNFALAQRAASANDVRLLEQAWPRAEQHLLAVLRNNPKDTTARRQLAQTYALTNNFDRAEEVLSAKEAERTPEIVRALSQVYMMRYSQSQSLANEKVTVNLQYLEKAMRIDPSNPYVAEAIAVLARLQGPTPSDEMIEHLKASLAEGTATAATHAVLAEIRLLRNQLNLAIPHLEQVINRLDNSAEYLNNLAFCLAELHPERYEEALGYALRAVAESKRQPNADYYDTLAHVFARLERHKEALTAAETAIELSPRRPDFHQRAADEYAALGDESMSNVHLKVIERLKVEEEARIEAERVAAERRATEERIEAERLAAQRLKTDKLEEQRFASEQAMAAIAEEVAREAAEKSNKAEETSIKAEENQRDE